MIEYFNIPPSMMINQPVTKKLFTEKLSMSSVEKRLLKNEILSIVMQALFQPRNTGLEVLENEEYLYNQLLIGEIEIKNKSKSKAIATMIQKAFPAHLFLILHCEQEYCLNWCNKKINQVEKDKRIVEEQQYTRWFNPYNDNLITQKWLKSLDTTKLKCNTIKDLFNQLSLKILSLSISDEAGELIYTDSENIEEYQILLSKINDNKEEQKEISRKLKEESQFNEKIRLAKRLKEVQNLNKELQLQLHK